MNGIRAKLELVDIQLEYPPSDRETGGGKGFLAVDLIGNEPAKAPKTKILPAEFTIILGPSGCGKSSLLRIIAGLELPTRGKVLKDGNEISGPGKDRGMVFQSYTSFPWLNVENNVLFGLRAHKHQTGSKNVRRLGKIEHERAQEVLDLVGLADHRHKYPKELSGGMKQRVAIARSLINQPDVLLMDEPFGALDPHIRLKMQELMLDIEEKLQTTIVFVTHDAREAVFLGDTIYLSTLCPCFLKYRLVHPFSKNKIPRIEAKRKYSSDFLLFQHQVEDMMHTLIEEKYIARIIEKDDWKQFHRSTLGMIEEIDDEK